MYKILVSNGHDSSTFYFDDKNQADLLYRMAVESGLFIYVQLLEVEENCKTIKEWSEDESSLQGL